MNSWIWYERLRPRRVGGALVATAFLLLLVLPSCKSKTEQESGAVARPANALELVLTYGSEKEKWINEVTNDFNRADHRTGSGKRIYVRAIPMGSGEAIDEVLEGRNQPHIISPASSAFIKLGNAKSQSKYGQRPDRADRKSRPLARRDRHVEADGRGSGLG